MAIKQAMHSFKGMHKDLSSAKASPEYLKDALNIRITPNGKDSLLSITCENNPQKKWSISAEELIKGSSNIESFNLLGYTTLQKNLVVFGNITCDYKKDYYISEEDFLSLSLVTDKSLEYYYNSLSSDIGINETEFLNDYSSIDVTYNNIPEQLWDKDDLSEEKEILRLARGLYQYVLCFTIHGGDSAYYPPEDFMHDQVGYRAKELETLISTKLFKDRLKDKKDSLYIENYINLSSTTQDIIFKISTETGEYTLLYIGDLNFPEEGNIDCLASYESEKIQKVYWVDGINPPRYINIAATEDVRNTWNDTSFDFVPLLKLQETFRITKVYQYGNFQAGTIQYCFNYFDKNGRESNIVDISPILYINEKGKGNKADDIVTTNAFEVVIQELDTSFKYIKIYAIHRSSLNGPAYVRSISKPINNHGNFTYIDNGLEGETIDPTELLYKGGESIIPKTIAEKDGTLFLGNIKLSNTQTYKFLTVKDILTQQDSYSVSWKSTRIDLKYSEEGLFINEYDEKIFQPSFKYGEYYRFGVQLQDNTGKWTPVIYIKDDVRPSDYAPIIISNGKDSVINTKYTYTLTINSKTADKLIAQGYKKIRPVVVLPNDNNREIIAQGIVCPTVYNYKQRRLGTCHAQSSWFFRPTQGNYGRFGHYPDQRAEVIFENKTAADSDDGWHRLNMGFNSAYWNPDIDRDYKKVFNRGYPVAYRHDELLPPAYAKNAELPHMWYDFPKEGEVLESGRIASISRLHGITSESWTSSNKEYPIWDLDYYAVDKNILTFHSPEIEFGNVTNLEGCKFRLVGYTLHHHTVRALDIIQEKNYFNIDLNVLNFGTISNGSGRFPIYTDSMNMIVPIRYRGTIEDNSLYSYRPYFAMYPWSKDNYYSGDYKLLYNKTSRLHVYYNTLYTIDAKNTDDKVIIPNTVQDVKIFDGTTDSIVLKFSNNIRWIENKQKNTFIYQGNVDYPITSWLTGNLKSGNEVKGYWHFLQDLKESYPEFGINTDPIAITATNGYPILGKYSNINAPENKYFGRGAVSPLLSNNKDESTDLIALKSNAPIRMTYKSSPHAVFALDHKLEEGFSRKYILPRLFEDQEHNETISSEKYYWIEGYYGNIIQNTVGRSNTHLDDNYPHRGYLYIGEFYREFDDANDKFGDPEHDTNMWNIAGASVLLTSNNVVLSYTDGDTFFTQYDCLKTYPGNKEDFNQLTEIGSFWLETRVNTAARYDNNKNLVSNLHVSPTNFNLYNNVYEQTNNFFTDRVLDPNYIDNINFPTTITWTKTKHSNDEVDPWTNITMASTLDLNGLDGELIKLYNFNNELFSFQPKGFNHILYNSRVQINASDGVPIEISNSNKVEGARKLASIGASNIRSINDNNSYLYFADSITKNIYRYDGSKTSSLTDAGFSNWALNNITDNMEVYVDNFNKNIYFRDTSDTENIMLCYSETLGEFESFFSYKSPIIKGYKDSYLLEKGTDSLQLYSMNSRNTATSSGSNNYPLEGGSYITFITNGFSNKNKCFTNIEFTADNTELHSPFTKVKIKDSNIKSSDIDLSYNKYSKSNIKKKFNTWRIDFPRVVEKGKYLRFNNPWVQTTLTLNRDINPEIHDIYVSYIE